MREMLLLAEQMKLSRQIGDQLRISAQRVPVDSRDEALPGILIEHADTLKSRSFTLDLPLEVRVLGSPFGVQGSERGVELEVAPQQR